MVTRAVSYQRGRITRCLVVVLGGAVLASVSLAPARAELGVVLQRGGRVSNGAARGDHVYVGQGATVVVLSAVAAEGEPSSILGPFPGIVQDVVTWRQWLLVGWSAYGRSGIERFWLENPSQPQVTGSLDVPGEATRGLESMAIVRDVLYVDGR